MTFLILLSFSGCTERVENTPPDGKTPGGNMIEGTVEPTESTPSTAEAEGSTADPTESGPQETEALIGPSGVKLRTSDKLICLVAKAGHLEFRFDNARAVNHRSDVQKECIKFCCRHFIYMAYNYSYFNVRMKRVINWIKLLLYERIRVIGYVFVFSFSYWLLFLLLYAGKHQVLHFGYYFFPCNYQLLFCLSIMKHGVFPWLPMKLNLGVLFFGRGLTVTAK